MIINQNFLGEGGAKQKPSVGGVWIFSGTAQYKLVSIEVTTGRVSMAT